MRAKGYALRDRGVIELNEQVVPRLSAVIHTLVKFGGLYRAGRAAGRGRWNSTMIFETVANHRAAVLRRSPPRRRSAGAQMCRRGQSGMPRRRSNPAESGLRAGWKRSSPRSTAAAIRAPNRSGATKRRSRRSRPSSTVRSRRRERTGCEGSGFFLFGRSQPPQCDDLNNRIQQMRANLDRLNADLQQLQSGGGAPKDSAGRS